MNNQKIFCEECNCLNIVKKQEFKKNEEIQYDDNPKNEEWQGELVEYTMDALPVEVGHVINSPECEFGPVSVLALHWMCHGNNKSVAFIHRSWEYSGNCTHCGSLIFIKFNLFIYPEEQYLEHTIDSINAEVVSEIYE